MDPDSNDNDIDNRPRGRSSRPEGRQVREAKPWTGRCFVCKEQGHKAGDCPQSKNKRRTWKDKPVSKKELVQRAERQGTEKSEQGETSRTESKVSLSSDTAESESESDTESEERLVPDNIQWLSLYKRYYWTPRTHDVDWSYTSFTTSSAIERLVVSGLGAFGGFCVNKILSSLCTYFTPTFLQFIYKYSLRFGMNALTFIFPQTRVLVFLAKLYSTYNTSRLAWDLYKSYFPQKSLSLRPVSCIELRPVDDEALQDQPDRRTDVERIRDAAKQQKHACPVIAVAEHRRELVFGPEGTTMHENIRNNNVPRPRTILKNRFLGRLLDVKYDDVNGAFIFGFRKLKTQMKVSLEQVSQLTGPSIAERSTEIDDMWTRMSYAIRGTGLIHSDRTDPIVEKEFPIVASQYVALHVVMDWREKTQTVPVPRIRPL